MMWCGRSGTPLPGAQHGKAAGWAGWTHDNQHEIRVACGLDNIRRSHRVCGRRTAEGREDAGRAGQMHGYDLDHIDLSFCDGRVVMHGFHDTNPAFSKLHSGCSCTHLTYTHIMLVHTQKHTCMHFYMCCILKASMLKAHMEHTVRGRVYLCVCMPV